MDRTHIVMAVSFLLITAAASARGQKSPSLGGAGPFFGLDLGVSEPVNGNYRAHVQTGGSVEPYAGYMFNRYLGLQGGLDYSFQQPDKDFRANLQPGLDNENRYTQMLGLTVGPRIEQRVSDLVNLYVTGQGGLYKGLSGRLNSWAPGVSVGGGRYPKSRRPWSCCTVRSVTPAVRA